MCLSGIELSDPKRANGKTSYLAKDYGGLQHSLLFIYLFIY